LTTEYKTTGNEKKHEVETEQMKLAYFIWNSCD